MYKTRLRVRNHSDFEGPILCLSDFKTGVYHPADNRDRDSSVFSSYKHGLKINQSNVILCSRRVITSPANVIRFGRLIFYIYILLTSIFLF